MSWPEGSEWRAATAHAAPRNDQAEKWTGRGVGTAPGPGRDAAGALTRRRPWQSGLSAGFREFGGEKV